MEPGKNRLKQLKRKLRKNPNSYEVNLQLGIFYFHKDDVAKAVGYLEKAGEANSDQPELLLTLANAYKILGNGLKSEVYFKRALDIQPENFKILYNYGVFLHDSHRLDDAADVFHKALQLEPDNFEILNDIGVIHYKQHRYQEAVHYLNKAVTINEDYLVAHINIAYAYLAANDVVEARNIIDRCEVMCPENPDVRELRLRLEARLNRIDRDEYDFQVELTFSEQLLQITPLKIIKKFSENGLLKEIGLSVVIPVKDEKDSIPLLYREIVDVLGRLKEGYEIIFIDDGSTDGTKEVLSDLAKDDPKVKVIRFRRNYGQTAAMNAGFKYSRGGVVVTLDGDLQNDPSDIPSLLEKMAEGYDLVSGWRKNRQDKNLTRKIPSMVANRIINKLIEGTGVRLNDFGCTLKAYKRGIVKNIHLYGEMHRFIPVFAAWLGVKVAEIPVNHRPRRYGSPKYNLSRVSRVIFDLIVVRFFSDYMTRPIQFFGKISRKLATTGMVGILILAGLNLFAGVPISLNTLLLLTAILLFSSLQILFAGLLGEIMIRSYFEGQGKDYYVIEKIVND